MILDIGLPGLDGYEVARLVRLETCAKARMIVISAYQKDPRRSLRAGFDQHFQAGRVSILATAMQVPGSHP